jgi:hypothetical protein
LKNKTIFSSKTSVISKYSTHRNRQEASIFKVRAAEIANHPLVKVSKSFQDLMAKTIYKVMT